MPRTTLLDAKNEGLPSAIGACPDDARFLLRLNTACRRLLKRGKYWGTFSHYRLCVTNSCLTLPPQIATLESLAVCGVPRRLHDQWFEFLENGFGIQQACGSSSNNFGGCGVNWGCVGDGRYRGRYPTFADVTGLDKKLWIVCDLTADVGKEVLVLGYDENNNWIRTVQDGVMADGEILALAQTPGTVSANIFSVITDVQLNESRDGQCWLYSLAPAYDPVTSDKVMLANYQYWEKHPSYARYYIGGILSGSGENGCALTTVDVMAKHDFIPVVKDNDYLVIGNLDALEFMIQALEKFRNGVTQAQVGEAIAFQKLAEDELDKELDHYRGSGVVTGITVSGSSIGTAENAPNYI